MPEVHDHDTEKQKPDAQALAFNDTLMSNPNVRKAYTAAKEQGLDEEEARESAVRTALGDEVWEERSREHEQPQREAIKGQDEDQDDCAEGQDHAESKTTLAKWGMEKNS